MWELACLRWRWVSYRKYRLTRRYRRQASSHIRLGGRLFQVFGFDRVAGFHIQLLAHILKHQVVMLVL